MAEEDDATEVTAPKRSKLPLILGVVIALMGGAGAFFFMYSSGVEVSEAEEPQEETTLAPAYFVALEPLVVPLGDGPANRVLRFQAHLEVTRSEMAQIEAMKPRILDVLNTYLRAVDLELLEDRRALLTLRAQMLRRVRIVTDEAAVRDLLITEFMIN